MQYDKEFKLQALELSDEIGVKAAADQLGIKYYTLADWRRQRKARGEEAFVGSDRLRHVGRMCGASTVHSARGKQIGTAADCANGHSGRTYPES